MLDGKGKGEGRKALPPHTHKLAKKNSSTQKMDSQTAHQPQQVCKVINVFTTNNKKLSKTSPPLSPSAWPSAPSSPFDVDFVPATVHTNNVRSELYIFEDNEATIAMLVKGRSPSMAHAPRTHRVDLDWIFELIVRDPWNVNLR